MSRQNTTGRPQPSAALIRKTRKLFKLIVTDDSENCIKLLKYFNAVIADVNKLGVYLKITKISADKCDQKTVELLKKQGITRTPALIAPDGAIFLGLIEIKKLFDKNLKDNKLRHAAKGSEVQTPSSGGSSSNQYLIGNNPDLADYYADQLFGPPDANGHRTVRTDADGEDDDAKDMAEKMRKYNERAAPRQSREMDINVPTPQRRVRPPPIEPGDNINIGMEDRDLPTPMPAVPRNHQSIPKGPPKGEDDMDSRMMMAWLDNNIDAQ
jgi:hypothetical protein